MYDYVIVGAGSAGCVLAARLSEDPDVSVLLLEAGPPDTSQNIHVPLGYLKLARTEVDWDYDSAPEANCNGRRIGLLNLSTARNAAMRSIAFAALVLGSVAAVPGSARAAESCGELVSLQTHGGTATRAANTFAVVINAH